MKQNQNPTTPIIQFAPRKQSTWLQQAKRLHDDGREEFGEVCFIARLGAQNLAFPRNNSFFALIDNMRFIEKSFFEFNYAIEQIEDVYNKAYSISERTGSHQLADVIPFPAQCKEVAR